MSGPRKANHVINGVTSGPVSWIGEFSTAKPDVPENILVQVALTGGGAAGSVVVSGRLDPSAPWVTLATLSAAGMTTNIQRYPYMQFTGTASAGTLDAWVL